MLSFIFTRSLQAAGISAALLFSTASAGAQSTLEFQLTGGNLHLSGDDQPSSTWLCGLSGVKGDFGDHDRDGGQEYVQVELSGGKWNLVTGSGRTGRMACSRLSNFTRRAGSVTLFSEEFFLASYNRNADFSKSTSLWWGDAASMITMMSGEFEGSNEKIEVVQNTNASTASTLKISSHAGDTFSNTDMEAAAYSVFLGNPSEHLLVRLIGYNSGGNKARGTAASAGTFVMPVSTQSGFSSFWLADVSGSNGGFCYFTKLSGDFNGSGESAIITQASGAWKLSVTAGSGSSAIASARCIAHDQR